MATPTDVAVRRRLTVAMVVRNAEPVLRASLESIRPLADEIVVLDAGSSDQSAEIARTMGAVVVQAAALAHVWADDFSLARNACYDRTTGDWVLWLDAGETLSGETGRTLRQFVDQQADPQTAYFLNITTPPEPSNLSGEQSARVRLVPRRSDLQFLGRVRENLLPTILSAGMKVERLAFTIKRGPREHDPAVKAERAQRNLRLAKLDLDQFGDQAEMLLTVGESLAALGKPAKAVDFFRRAVGEAHRASTTMLEAYYGLLTSLDGLAEGREQQLAACLEALEIYPLDAQLLCGMGSYMLAQNRPDLAVRSYKIAVQHGQIDPQTWHLPDIAEVAAACLSLTLQLLEREDEARQVLDDQLLIHPKSERLRRQLINLHIKHSKVHEALHHVDLLPAGLPHRAALRAAVRGATLASSQNWIAARPYLETAYEAGCRDPLCLRWLSVVCLMVGAHDDAAEILDQWQQLEPTNTEITSYLSALSAARANAAPPASAADEPRDGTPRPRFRIDPQQAPASRPATDHAPAPRSRSNLIT